MTTLSAPFYPIIYVRGFAMTRGEIEATTSTPYMGFNQGATKVRQHWDGKVTRRYFESPLIRLMKDYGYEDFYLEGKLRTGKVSAKTIFIHRYYDEADPDFGSGKRPSIPEAAESLKALIASVRKAVCGDDKSKRLRNHALDRMRQQCVNIVYGFGQWQLRGILGSGRVTCIEA